MAAALQKFCLKWNNFQNSVTSVFDTLRQDEELVDITLCCEGQKIKAHRMMLSACSPYFRDLLKENPCQHPVFFLKDTSFPDLAAVVEFVYKGEVNVLQSQLGSFLKTAEMLQVKGLSGDDDDEGPGRPQATVVGAGASPAERPSDPPRPRHNSSQPPADSPHRPRPREPPDCRPGSPRAKRRRLSGGDPRVASSPSPLPAAPPPPPPQPAAPVATIDLDPPPPAAALESPLEAKPLLQPPQSAGPPQQQGEDGYGIKVEKVDLADGEDDASLETALGQVSTMEAQFEGSDHSASSHDMAGLFNRLSEQGGSGDMSMAGTAGTSEDGSSQGRAAAAGRRSWLLPWLVPPPAAAAAPPAAAERRIACPTCGRDFTQASYSQHVAMHRGRTTCHVCQAVYATRFGLRRHLAQRHPEHSAERAEDAPGPYVLPSTSTGE